MKLLYLFLFLFLNFFQSAFCSSPRLLVFFGSNCDFIPQDILQSINANIVSGTSDEIKIQIRANERQSLTHLTLVDGSIDDLFYFTREVGYGTLYLDGPFEEALVHLDLTLKTFPLTDASLPKMNPQDVGLFYDLMQKVDHLFKEKDLTYWGIYGTLLGAVRHQGMIPWDDDIDIAIFEEDLPLLLSLEADFAKLGLELYYFSLAGFYKIYYKNGAQIIQNGEVTQWTFPFIDIMIWSKKGRHVRQEIFENYYCLEDELQLPLEELVFGPLVLPVPHDADIILERWYREDWNEVAFVEYSHRHECILEKIKVDLVDRSPPEYILP